MDRLGGIRDEPQRGDGLDDTEVGQPQQDAQREKCYWQVGTDDKGYI